MQAGFNTMSLVTYVQMMQVYQAELLTRSLKKKDLETVFNGGLFCRPTLPVVCEIHLSSERNHMDLFYKFQKVNAIIIYINIFHGSVIFLVKY